MAIQEYQLLDKKTIDKLKLKCYKCKSKDDLTFDDEGEVICTDCLFECTIEDL